MAARMWNNTDDEPDRRERRMAECLVRDHVPFEAFDRIVAQNGQCQAAAQAALASVGSSTPVSVTPSWYF